MHTCIRTTLICCLILVMAAAISARDDNSLSRSLPDASFQLEDATIAEAVGSLSQHYGVPFGLIKSVLDDGSTRINLKVVNERLDNVLMLVHRQTSTYEWRFADGVVLVEPATTERELLRELAMTVIPRFSSKAGITKRELRVILLGTIELKEFFKANGLRLPEFEVVNDYERQTPLYEEILMTGASLMDILNYVVRRGPDKIWSITFNRDERKLVNVIF